MIPAERIDRSILLIRGEKAMLNADLAVLYGVPTKALNQAVKRNNERFPSEFMFQLTAGEKAEVVTNCDHLKKLSEGCIRTFAKVFLRTRECGMSGLSTPALRLLAGAFFYGIQG